MNFLDVQNFLFGRQKKLVDDQKTVFGRPKKLDHINATLAKRPASIDWPPLNPQNCFGRPKMFLDVQQKFLDVHFFDV